jgi:signal transduction histidine kinase
VKADSAQIDLVLTNLAVNAEHAMAERDARLEVSTTNVSVDEAFVRSHSGAQPGEFVRLRVYDNGSGMDAHTLARVFEPFFTTKAPGKGTGLGLSAVLGIMQQHGGFVDVTSTLGAGSTFDLYFPCTREPAE